MNEAILILTGFAALLMIGLGIVGWIMDVDRRYISKTYDPDLKYVKLELPKYHARADHAVYDWKKDGL